MARWCQVYNRAIFLYTNKYLRDFDPSCKHFPQILGLRLTAPSQRVFPELRFASTLCWEGARRRNY